MQTSNHQDYIQPKFELDDVPPDVKKEKDEHRDHFIFVLCILCLFAGLMIWIMQNSVNAYYQQTYHRESPLIALEKYDYWRMGGTLGNYFYAQHDGLKNTIADQNTQWVNQFNQDYAYTERYKQLLAEKAKQEKIRLAQEAAARAHQAMLDQFTLTRTDQVFFAGDSLMQGVAPHVQKYLQENYEVKTVNLSKQSTGLSYPNFFNWPQTIKETLQSNPAIKVLVVFLGPNDPWDMPNPQGGLYLRFKSPEWEAVYRSRIAEIIESAKQHNVSVMWLTPPNMRKELPNQQMVYLNQVITDEVKKHQAFLIDSRPIFGGKNDVYSDYIVKDHNSIKMRSADGIHFSPDGQKIIAKTISDHLKVID